MRYRKLGRTQLEVSEIGYGAWGIGGVMWADSQDDTSNEALEKAISLGLSFIDTAYVYGDGHSEELVGQVRKRHPSVTVATKVPPKNYLWPARPGMPIKDVFPLDWIIDCTERSLKKLGVEQIDLQQLHVWSPEFIRADEWREGAERLKKQGKIRFFGVSVNDHQPQSVMELVRTGLIDTVQVIYNIFDQSPGDELLQLCGERNVGVIARCPFDEGGLTGAIKPGVTFPKDDWRNRYFSGDRPQQVWEHVEKLRAEIGGAAVSLPDAALRYCLSNPAVSVVIPGMRRPSSVEQNCASSDHGPLPGDLLERLKAHRWVRNFYPA
jgi:aryl-alcohol dehydrogenase-like predicted oxidoreductase